MHIIFQQQALQQATGKGIAGLAKDRGTSGAFTATVQPTGTSSLSPVYLISLSSVTSLWEGEGFWGSCPTLWTGHHP